MSDSTAPDPLQEMLERSGAAGSLSASSRYRGIARAALEGPEGEPIPYLRRRFLPRPESLGVLVERVVAEGERLDAIAAEAFGDPELFWRLCEANLVLRPSDLVERPGASICVPTGGARLG